MTFTAHVAPSTASGTVIFSDGGTAFGAGTLSGGVATFTTTAFAVGTHSIAATYGGDSKDAASASASVSVGVTASSLKIAASTSSLTITQGNTGSTVISVTPLASYTGTLTFACSGLPQYASCTFSPATLTFAGGSNESVQSTTLKIATDVTAQTANSQPTDTPIGPRMLALLPAVAMLGCLRRRKTSTLCLLLLLSLGTFGVLSGCGYSTASTEPTQPATPLGKATVTVSSGSSGPSLELAVTVTQ